MSEEFKYQQDRYARFRPVYPPELFRWLASTVTEHHLAWDCGTGSGQAALGLADYFDHVAATDVNWSQLAHAASHPSIFYTAARAEKSMLATGCASLITVACAVHWFDRNFFYEEAARVLKTGGVLAVWTYSWPCIGIPEIDEILTYYKDDVLGAYWPEASRLYFEGYRGIEFPFDEITAPDFGLECLWNAEGLLHFLSTWSAVQRYLRITGRDAADSVRANLVSAWERHKSDNRVMLPLYFRVGRSKK